MSFTNNPHMRNVDGEHAFVRHTHAKLTNYHNGIQFTINENGKIDLSKPGKDDVTGEPIVDEMQVPASLIFKLATLLRATRHTEVVPISEATKPSEAKG